jgi:hypothetical protein
MSAASGPASSCPACRHSTAVVLLSPAGLAAFWQVAGRRRAGRADPGESGWRGMIARHFRVCPAQERSSPVAGPVASEASVRLAGASRTELDPGQNADDRQQ